MTVNLAEKYSIKIDEKVELYDCGKTVINMSRL